MHPLTHPSPSNDNLDPAFRSALTTSSYCIPTIPSSFSVFSAQKCLQFCLEPFLPMLPCKFGVMPAAGKISSRLLQICQGLLIKVLNSLDKRRVWCQCAECSPHMGINNLQPIHIARVDPSKSVKKEFQMLANLMLNENYPHLHGQSPHATFGITTPSCSSGTVLLRRAV